MNRSTTLLLALLLCLVVAIPAADARGKRPALRAATVLSPAYAHAGGTLPVRLTVTGSTTARAARTTRLRVLLSKDRRRSKDDVTLKSRGRLTPAPRSGKATAAITATIAARQPAGARYVIACVAARGRTTCATTRGRVTISVAADPARTSAALIEADRRAGRLTDGQALSYRVLALFGDSRLPARYAGDTTAEEDDGAMRDAAARWSSLTPQARKAIAPYFRPPTVRATAKRAKASTADDDDFDEAACSSSATKTADWESFAAAGGKVRLNWEKSVPEDGKDIRQVAKDVTTAYARFKEILGREPLSDAGARCPHGKDGALDIYFVDGIPKADALTIPSDIRKYQEDFECKGFSSFIIAERDTSFTTRFVLAHELFHAFTNSFPRKGSCGEYAWFDEGAANWGAHAAFPTDDGEHFFKWGLEDPASSLTDQDYHAWVFALWMERTFGERSIRSAYDAFGRQLSLQGIDKAIGGLRSHFLDFARHGWNQAPLDPSFVAWDRFPVTPKEHFVTRPWTHLFLAGAHSRTAYVLLDLWRAARSYDPLEITDEQVKEVVFRNPVAGDPDARIGAILTFKSGAVRFDDWSGKERVTFCRDNPGQDVVKIVVVAGNSSVNERHHIAATAELGLRDQCDGMPWHFKVLNATLETHADGGRSGSSDSLCATFAGLPIHGQTGFTAATADDVFDRKNDVTLGFGGRVEGAIGVRAPAAFRHDLVGCAPLFGDGQPQVCSAALNRPAGGDGGWDIGFEFLAASASAKTATLTWWIPDPAVGFFDADDTVCNVEEIWHGLAPEKERQEVPLSWFAATTPFVLEFHSKDQWAADELGRPATLAYDWTYRITLQRVDEQGRPL